MSPVWDRDQEVRRLILWKEGETQAQIDEAHAIIEALDSAYPGHPWAVRVYDGGFFIRHLDCPATWGMNCKGNYASASLMKRDVILKAGEWLERAGIKRARYDEDQPEARVEGVPEKFQPASTILVKQKEEENGHELSQAIARSV